MAFLQPQQRRPIPISQPAVASEAVNHTTARKRQLQEDAQEWILFSPAVDDQVSTTSRTSQTPRTANFSHLSDLDSLHHTNRLSNQDAIDKAACQDTDADDEDAEELDSLDDGLHAFQSPMSPHLGLSDGAVLPMHDGLGTFPSTHLYDNLAAIEGMQEHLWQFERYNPHRQRQHRRRSSLQKRLDLLGDDQEEVRGLPKHEERRMRIEQWRLEQSRAVLEEIERETRRRRRTMTLDTPQTSSLPIPESAAHHRASTTTDRELPSTSLDNETESFWQRITRTVIKDLMGLDDTTLSVIFGERLPPDLDDLGATPTQPSPLSSSNTDVPRPVNPDMPWELRLLDRIARELGFLAHRLSEHDGAFNTFRRASISENPVETRAPHSSPLADHSVQSLPTLPINVPSTNDAFFSPTLPRTRTTSTPLAHDSLWGIEEEPPLNRDAPLSNGPQQTRNEKEYWERDLDVGVIFRYLRNRFSSRTPPPAPAEQASHDTPSTMATGPLPRAWASNVNSSALGTSPESFRRADMIQRHHPLVSHAATMSATRRRESLILRRQHQSLLHRRAGTSSCASQSTKRTRSGGSRRYWDFPSAAGSAAGGSLVSVTSGGYEGMMGSWGEV